MSFKPFTIVLLLVTVYFHSNVLAFPAAVNPYASSQSPEAEGSPGAVLADVTGGTPGGNGAASLATVGGDPSGKNADPNAKTGESIPGKTGTKATGTDLTGKTPAGGKGSKAAGLTQAELVEACAPLLGKTTATPAPKGDSLTGKTGTPVKSENALGGKNVGLPGGKVDGSKNGGVGALGGKNATAGGKTPAAPKKSSASIFIRSSSMVTTAIPIILSTGVGLLVP